jgi:hypothetical protein
MERSQVVQDPVRHIPLYRGQPYHPSCGLRTGSLTIQLVRHEVRKRCRIVLGGIHRFSEGDHGFG